MISCEICGTPLRIIDNIYVCDEGHAIENKVEVADDTHMAPTSCVQEEASRGFSPSECGPGYLELLVFYLMFEDVRTYLGIVSSRYFEIFVNFFRGDGDKIVHGPSLCFSTLRALTYYSKRVEMESEDKTYMYLEYCRDMEHYPFEERIQQKLDVLNLNASHYKPFSMCVREHKLYNVYSVLRCLGDVGVDLRRDRIGRPRRSETGVLDEEIENNKLCFRQDLRRDYQMFLGYLRRLCSIFMLEITEDLEEKFKIFFYASDFSQVVHIPEVEISPFLYIYIMRYGRDLDVGRAIRRFRDTLLGSFYGMAGDEACERYKDTDQETVERYDLQSTFQESVRFLLSRIVPTRKSREFMAGVSRLKVLLHSATSLEKFRSHWKKIHGIPTQNFHNAVWYIRKLKFQRRRGRRV